MDRIEVSSSNISSIGYDSLTETLEIAFHSGVYQYHGVPESVYNGLMSASSHGKYLHQNIKGLYSYKRV